ALVIASSPARANRESTELCAQASRDLYNLDLERAIETYRRASKSDPADSAAQRGLATSLWLFVTYDRGTVTVDEYLGRPSTASRQLPPPPAETATAFRVALDNAVAVARRHIATAPKDPDGH